MEEGNQLSSAQDPIKIIYRGYKMTNKLENNVLIYITSVQTDTLCTERLEVHDLRPFISSSKLIQDVLICCCHWNNP